MIDVTELLEADLTQTFMKRSAVSTPERPERRRRAHSAELQTDDSRRKSSTSRGKKTFVHRDRTQSPSQPDKSTYTIPPTLTDGNLSASLTTAGWFCGYHQNSVIIHHHV